MSESHKIWLFSNHYLGYYKDSDWDTSTILHTKHYYFKESEPNRTYVKKGHSVVFRTYGSGFWGTCDIASDWVPDPQGKDKHETKTGWFEITGVKKWRASLPYEIIRSELSNQNHRLRIASATEEDFQKIELGLKIYKNLGYGSVDGEFFMLESGLEEAVKKNINQLDLKLADESIQQQCSLDIGIGRTDLICRDRENNYVVLELKSVQTSDTVVGQILRYIGYIRENWADKEGKKVKGIIITPGYDEQLRLAAKAAGIKVLRLRMG